MIRALSVAGGVGGVFNGRIEMLSDLGRIAMLARKFRDGGDNPLLLSVRVGRCERLYGAGVDFREIMGAFSGTESAVGANFDQVRSSRDKVFRGQMFDPLQLSIGFRNFQSTSCAYGRHGFVSVHSRCDQ